MSEQNRKKPILGKIIIQGQILCKTGLHIGSSKETLEIGGLDSPVVRDPITREPYIPGSSLRGKLRSLLEKKENKHANRHSGQGVYRHECTDKSCTVCRLFGATADKREDKNSENQPARLCVRDARLTEESLKELDAIDTGLQYTELKFENALDRITAAANPRQIERVPAGTRFRFEMVYTAETENKAEIETDLKNLLGCLNMLHDDYLGGHGSRGYGQVKIEFHQDPIIVRKVDYYLNEKKDGTQKAIAGENIEQLLPKIAEITQFLGITK